MNIEYTALYTYYYYKIFFFLEHTWSWDELDELEKTIWVLSDGGVTIDIIISLISTLNACASSNYHPKIIGAFIAYIKV